MNKGEKICFNILDIATSGDMDRFINILLFSICYFILLGLFMFCYSVFSRKLICRVINLLREKNFYGIVNRNIADYHETNTAAYLSALTNDVKMVEESYLLPLLEMIQNGIVFTTSLIVMFYFDVLVAPAFQTSIVVKDLKFGYTQDQPIIKGIDFSFQKGKKYAIVGKSGCGKTTLINLLNGYYAGFQGDILYDGVGIRELDIQKLNEMSSVIHQNVYMFDESIKNNICLHKQISQSKLQSALDMSGVTMFLSEEKTLDTSVGENGNNLSGGQRQRIAVARALVQEKSILVLDEGTSAVDMQTAYDIESQLLKLSDLTVITITHSLNSELLEDYDQILFMEDGIIAEVDSFNRLMESKEAFFNFFNLKTKV